MLSDKDRDKEVVSLVFQRKQPTVAWDHCPERNWAAGRDRWSHPKFHLPSFPRSSLTLREMGIFKK